MRIISQSGRNDVQYDITHLHVVNKTKVHDFIDDDDENEWLLLAECVCMDSTIKLASFDTEEEAKRMLMDIAHGWKHNYPIFYCGEKE